MTDDAARTAAQVMTEWMKFAFMVIVVVPGTNVCLVRVNEKKHDSISIKAVEKNTAGIPIPAYKIHKCLTDRMLLLTDEYLQRAAVEVEALP